MERHGPRYLPKARGHGNRHPLTRSALHTPLDPLVPHLRTVKLPPSPRKQREAGRQQGEEESCAGRDAIRSHCPGSAHLVLLCIHCLQSTEPIQSQQSCKLVHSPLECLLIADLCGCNSCARCKPFLQQPVESQGRGTAVTPQPSSVHAQPQPEPRPWPTCAAMSTRFGNFRARPSPSFKKSSKLPMKEIEQF